MAPGHQTVADMPGYHADPYMNGGYPGYAGYPYGSAYGYPGAAAGAYGGAYPGYNGYPGYQGYPHAHNDVDADGVYDPADPVYGASPPNDYDADGLNDHHDPDDMGPGPEDSFHVPADCEAAIEASPTCSVNPVVRGCLDGNMELCWQIEHHIPASVLEDCKGEAIAQSCDAPSGAMEDVDADVEESGAYGPVATDNAVDDVPNDADYTPPVTTAAGTVTGPAFMQKK
jgi:hypothetical protein